MHAYSSSGGRAGVEAASPASPASAPAKTPKPSIDPAKLKVEEGTSAPLGASPGASGTTGVNFALWAPAATTVTLCLRDWDDVPVLDVPMHRTGDTWHAYVAGLPRATVLYGYRVDGNGGWETPYRWDKNKVGGWVGSPVACC